MPWAEKRYTLRKRIPNIEAAERASSHDGRSRRLGLGTENVDFAEELLYSRWFLYWDHRTVGDIG